MDFLSPKNLSEALELRKKNPDYNILAGGTDICVLMNSGILKPLGLINICGVEELKGIKETKDSVEIGALTTYTELIKNELVQKNFQALVESCKTIGAVQIQNRGTIGGNIMNASPAGDTLPVLLVYDALIEVKNTKGSRQIKFTDFYKGYRKAALEKDEIVTKITIPKTKRGEKSAFIKIGTRRAQAISKVMGAFRMQLDGEEVAFTTIAFGSVAPVPVRLYKTEEYLLGKKLTENVISGAAKIASNEASPIDDIRSTSKYRRHICGVLVKRFLELF